MTKASFHQLGALGLSQGLRVITLSFRLADTTGCWRRRSDLSLDNAKDVALPCGCVLRRWDLHLFVSTAASSGLCGCPCAAFSSDRVTLNNHRPPWQERGAGFRTPRACV